MQFGVGYYEIIPAICIGIWLGIQAEGSQARAIALGAQISFIVGAALMLFSENAWWPVTARLLELVFWVVSGSFVAWVSYWVSRRAKRKRQNSR
jgi:hypothetical protein